MPPAEATFREATPSDTPIRDLRLSIAGTDLEAVLAEFERELARAGLRKVRPRFYLSTEWGVPFGTVAVAIPFYLARRDLTDLHARHAGHVEGVGRADILRYLRHEMGHVVNYAYRLYETPEWVRLFGDINRPYVEEYRPEPFDPRYVRHLPGWYAQKHPDEDWAETFAVWLTPGRDWRAEYARRPAALAKLEYCDRTLAELAGRDPPVIADEPDEDVGELTYSLEEYYRALALPAVEFAPGLEGALRSAFEDLAPAGEGSAARPVAELIGRLERDLTAEVYRWTGHFPERTRLLLRHLAERAGQLRLAYTPERETAAVVALTTLVTALAMNHVRQGEYLG